MAVSSKKTVADTANAGRVKVQRNSAPNGMSSSMSAGALIDVAALAAPVVAGADDPLSGDAGELTGMSVSSSLQLVIRKSGNICSGLSGLAFTSGTTNGRLPTSMQASSSLPIRARVMIVLA